MKLLKLGLILTITSFNLSLADNGSHNNKSDLKRIVNAISASDFDQVRQLTTLFNAEEQKALLDISKELILQRKTELGEKHFLKLHLVVKLFLSICIINICNIREMQSNRMMPRIVWQDIGTGIGTLGFLYSICEYFYNQYKLMALYRQSVEIKNYLQMKFVE